MSITYTPEQRAVIDGVNRMIRTGETKITVFGLAGTGKTTIGTAIVQEHNGIPCAYTARAAHRFAAKCDIDGLMGSTAHSLLYTPQELEVPVEWDEHGNVTKRKKKTFFADKENSCLAGSVIVIDECSMIGMKMGNDFRRTGATIIALGDPGQLPPIADEQFFKMADFTLTEIHRQAQDSPIIRQAHEVRYKGRYAGDTDDFQVLGISDLTDELLMWPDAILAFKKTTRSAYNRRLRKLHGKDGIPRAGEPIMILNNTPKHRVFNGMIYELLEDYDPDGAKPVMVLRDGDTEIRIPRVQMCSERDDWDKTKYTTFADFSYAMTVHKAQGSEFDKVLVIDEYPSYTPRTPQIAAQRRPWVYTAVTRASKSIVIAR